MFIQSKLFLFKKCLQLLIVAAFSTFTSFAQSPKIISDGTIIYSVIDSDSAKQKIAVSQTVYLKGKDLRTDFTSSRFNQTIFYAGKTESVVVLKTIGQSKYISYYDSEEWKKQNEIYNGIKLSLTDGTKNILDHECKEALLTLNNGNSYTVYYWAEYIPSVQPNSFQFKGVPGLVLEYELKEKGRSITYTATSINFDPVPSVLFEIPVKGYRLLK